MAKSVVSSKEFVKMYATMARQGVTSALEIGRALGLKGDNEKVAKAVSIRASQLRKRFKETALKVAAERKLSEADTKELVANLVGKLPRLKAPGRQSNTMELVNEIDSVLAALDNAE